MVLTLWIMVGLVIGLVAVDRLKRLFPPEPKILPPAVKLSRAAIEFYATSAKSYAEQMADAIVSLSRDQRWQGLQGADVSFRSDADPQVIEVVGLVRVGGYVSYGENKIWFNHIQILIVIGPDDQLKATPEQTALDVLGKLIGPKLSSTARGFLSP